MSDEDGEGGGVRREEVTSLEENYVTEGGEGDDVTGDDVTRQESDITGGGERGK